MVHSQPWHPAEVSGRHVEQEPRTRPHEDGSLAALLSRALDERGMSLTQLQGRLRNRGHRVSLASLSYWRSGQRRPETADSLDTIAQIEEILDLEPGRLRNGRGPSRRAGRWERPVPFGELVPTSVPVDDALASLDLTAWTDYVVEDVVHLSVDVDGAGTPTRSTSQILLRAVQDGALHYPFYVFAGADDPRPPVLSDLRGATVTGHQEVPEAGLVVWRATLPRPLAAGETAMIEAVVELGDTGEPETEWVHYAVRRLSELTVWVRFDPTHLPRSCELLVEGEDGEPRRTPVDVSGMHSAHLTVRGFGPGRAGVLFDWA
jgi:hypothetical protein